MDEDTIGILLGGVDDAMAKTEYLAHIPRLWLDGKDEDKQKVSEKISPREKFVTVDELEGELRRIKEGK